MKFRSYKIYALAALLSVYGTACTSGYEEMNEDPNRVHPDQVTPNMQFGFILGQVAGDRQENGGTNLSNASCQVQHLASIEGSGDRYTSLGGQTDLWSRAYQRQVKNVEDLLHRTSGKPEEVNRHNIARMMRVYIYQRLTDLYGDIPYFQAGKGHITGITAPAYDKQEDIYKDFLKELEEAVAALDATKPTYDATDFAYSGNLDKWRKFGNSLRLRVAMRLSEKEPALAQQHAVAAIAGGIMESNADLARMNHYRSSDDKGMGNNGIAQHFLEQGITSHNLRVSAHFLELLRKYGEDPRTQLLMAVYNKNEIKQPVASADFVGLPNGLNTEEISAIVAQEGFGDLGNLGFVQPDREHIVGYNAPTIFFSYAEAMFLAAEAVQHGWVADANYLERGIRGAIDMIVSAYKIAEPAGMQQATDAYVAAVLADNATPAIEKIMEQKYIALFLNGYEAYAEWRRTGLPRLTPVKAPGNMTDGQIPRRYQYPSTEYRLNAEHIGQAVDRLGQHGDDMRSRMWWDLGNK